MCVFAWCMGVWVDGRVFATLWLFNLNMQIESRLKTRPAKSSGTKKKNVNLTHNLRSRKNALRFVSK